MTIHTLRKLAEIKAGERLTVYRGNIEDDLAASKGPARGVLEAVRDVINALARNGGLELVPETITVKQRNGTVKSGNITRYIAVGATTQ